MKFSGSMITLAAPQLAAGALVGSLVAGAQTAPRPEAFTHDFVVLVSGNVRHLVQPDEAEDRADRDVSLAELTRWGRSMMGGDTSHMLDI
ncbi:MAG: hypothetical protein M3P26_06115 [Gemmatimonadota bacterium]|nr:hypothetical protein [Gemmatimonadota bacterium]